MKKNKLTLIISIVAIAIVAVVVSILVSSDSKITVTNFEECIAAGNPVMESYPRQCRHDNQTFTEGVADVFTEPVESGVRGRVTLGPVCSDNDDSSDLSCENIGYKTTVQVIEIGSPKSSPFVAIMTSSDGQYETPLPPGEYGLQPIGSKCETKDIVIKPGQMIEVDLLCDTGN